MYIVIIFIIIIFLAIFLLFKFKKKKIKLSKNRIIFFNTQLKRIIISNNYKEQIIDIDKLYHKLLIEIGYKGTFGEILKQEPIYITNLQIIWESHKLRNKLVHDFDLLSENILKKNSISYIKQFNELLKKVS